MAFLGLSDRATLVALGLLLIGINLSGILGYVTSSSGNSRAMSRLRKQVPVFREVPEDKLFRWISWAGFASGIFLISIGVVVLFTTKR